MAALLQEESAGGLLTADHYRDFTVRVAKLKESLLAELARRKAAGQHIAAYGASAKGSTLLNYFGIAGKG